jgi:hypothetical protein
MNYLTLLLIMFALALMVEKQYRQTAYQRALVAIKVKEVTTGKNGC